jgi:hypothetical protein
LLQLCLHCKFAIQNWFGNDHRSAAVRSAHRWTKLYSYGANMAAPKSSQDADAGIGPLERLENNWADRKGRVRMLCSVDFQHHRFSDQHAGASFRSRSWRLYRSTSSYVDKWKTGSKSRQLVFVARGKRLIWRIAYPYHGGVNPAARGEETEAAPQPAHVVEQTFNTNLWNGWTL